MDPGNWATDLVAVFPLAMFTGDRRKMGEFTNSRWIQALA